MRKLLIRLNVAQFISVELSVTKESFIENLKSQVDEEQIHILSNQFDLKNSKQKLYKGTIRKKNV